MFPLEPTTEEVAATRAGKRDEERLTDATSPSWGFPNAMTYEGPILPTLKSTREPQNSLATKVIPLSLTALKRQVNAHPKGRLLCPRQDVVSVRHSGQSPLLASSGKG